MLSLLKIDEAFPNQRIMINGYKLFCRDRNCHCGGVTTENKNLEVFMNSFGLAYLIKKPLCFQSKNPISINLILTNKKDVFKNSNVSEVGISDHHSFIITALNLKSQLAIGNAKTKLYG